jgi:hypothetical protein
VAREFGEEEAVQTVGRMYFGRFFANAIATPHLVGIASEAAYRSKRDELMLLAALLHHVAENSHFGKKQVLGDVLNAFIDARQPRLSRFFAELAADSALATSPKIETLPAVPRDVAQQALLALLNYLQHDGERKTVLEALRRSGSEEDADELEDILDA